MMSEEGNARNSDLLYCMQRLVRSVTETYPDHAIGLEGVIHP